MQQITISTAFKAKATQAIISIVLFVLVYLSLITAAISITALCFYGGAIIMLSVRHFFGILIGLGLASVGLFILFFLVKFMFKKNKVDRTGLIEITAQDEPVLFEMIAVLVKEIGTNFPKKVYLSHQVDAAVFYNSSFWSMFVPIRKNLLIGMGLINTLTVSELKAVLAHEFGHFSQKTMQVGSYVYNVNQVIYNLLYENNSYFEAAQGWANLHSIFRFFVLVSVKIVQGIQFLLQKMYALVNKRYMALSREMEFHADAIAASVTGYEPLQTALLRFDLAQTALSEVYDFYDKRIQQNQISANLYPEQYYAMKLLANYNQIITEHQLPLVTLESIARFNKSQLVFSDQWASHPSTKQRVLQLQDTQFTATQKNTAPATSIFQKLIHWQELLTQHVFNNVAYTAATTTIHFATFKEAYTERFQSNLLPECYNSYFDHKDIADFDTTHIKRSETTFEELFSTTIIDEVYTWVALDRDIFHLTMLIQENKEPFTFDYEGVRYASNNAPALIETLQAKAATMQTLLAQHDQKIYHYFLQLEQSRGLKPKLQNEYQAYFSFRTSKQAQVELLQQLHQSLAFVSKNTPFKEIEANLDALRPIEEQLKGHIRAFLSNTQGLETKDETDQEAWRVLKKYESRQHIYFSFQSYDDEALKILFGAINHYEQLLSRKHFLLKKQLLVYQTTLL